MSSPSHDSKEIGMESVSMESSVRHRHNVVQDKDENEQILENAGDQSVTSVIETKDPKISKKSPLVEFYKYQRQIISLPIWNWFSQRFPVADHDGSDGTRMNPVLLLQIVTRHINERYLEGSTEGDEKMSLSFDEADSILVIVWIGMTPCLIILFTCTHFIKTTLLITSTWLYPTFLTYAHLEHHSYPKVGFYLIAWVFFSFFLLLEQYYLQFIHYTLINRKSSISSLSSTLNAQENLSFTYVCIKSLVFYILLSPKWQLIIPLIQSITQQIDSSTTLTVFDWEHTLKSRDLLRDKMTKESSHLDESIQESDDNSTNKNFDEGVDNKSNATPVEKFQTNGNSSDDDDNFSYVHVEEEAEKEMGSSVQKEVKNIPSTITYDIKEQKNICPESDFSKTTVSNVPDQMSKKEK